MSSLIENPIDVETTPPIKIALVGRANVGKSTLFNCFSKGKSAMVYDKPGVTRDVRLEPVEWLGYKFELADTPGIDLYDDPSLKTQVIKRIKETIDDSDYVWFLTDGTAGITHFDREIAQLLRKSGKPVIILVNKIDRKDCDELAFYALGFKNLVSISAEHKSGLYEIFEFMNQNELSNSPDLEQRNKIAILGRPNAGKSTFVNTILGKDYQLTGSQPGLTRESIGYPFNFEGQKYELIDTAGLRKKSKMYEDLERLSWGASFESLKFAECVLYLIDGEAQSEFGLDQQDLIMIHRVLDEGRCLVVGLSKWETVNTQKKILENIRHSLNIKGFSHVPIIPLSSFKKFGLTKVFEQIQTSLKYWNKRISTGKLNPWLREVVSLQPPPSINGRMVKMKFITQVKTRPPRLCVFVNVIDPVLEKYKRFLTNRFHEHFGFQGVPIRIFFRTTKNPYAREHANTQ